MKLKGIELKGTYKFEIGNNYFDVCDEKGNNIYFENSDGFWIKRKFDSNGYLIFFEDSNGVWFKNERDEKGNQIYYEDSKGLVIDNRVKELTIEEIEKILGYKIKIKGENK